MGYKQIFNPLSGTFDTVLNTESPAFTGIVTIDFTDPGIVQQTTSISPSFLSIEDIDLAFGTTVKAAIEFGQMSLTYDDGITITPTTPSLPEHVTTKFYVDGLAKLTIASPTANFSILSTQKVVLCTNTITVLLPIASSVFTPLYIKNIGVGVITIDGNGSQTIDGALTYALTNQWDSITLVSNGTGWFIL
jgi:hypothetical protein